MVPLTQGFLNRGLVEWHAHKHGAAAADPVETPTAKGTERAPKADRAAAKGPAAAASEAAGGDSARALITIYSQRCQARPT